MVVVVVGVRVGVGVGVAAAAVAAAAAAAAAAGGSGVALFKGFRRDVRQFFVIWRRASSIQKPFLALSSGAATTEVAAEQLTAGAGQQEGHVDKLPRAAKSWKFVFFN